MRKIIMKFFTMYFIIICGYHIVRRFDNMIVSIYFYKIRRLDLILFIFING